MAAILVSSPAAYSSASLRPECHIQPSQMEQRCEIQVMYTGGKSMDVYRKFWAISLDV